MSVSGAVGEGVGVCPGSVTSDGRRVVDYHRIRCRYDVIAGIMYSRNEVNGGHGEIQTADSGRAVFSAYGKVLGLHMVGIGPSIVGTVDGVVINECGVSETVNDVAIVFTGVESDGLTAVGNVGQGWLHDL